MTTEQRTVPVDQPQRDAALDPARSFIVQAPAGSGKTGLLTQRFLGLLTTVEEPEEIVAVTFTRKAAAEMRERILQALAWSGEEPPRDPYERRTWSLARAARAHADEREWHLLENPQRLRVRTIDSLSAQLARQMPLRSGFGDAPATEERAEPMYREAAASVLSELETDGALGDALSVLLPELDNDVGALQRLLAEMLARRDQWLPVVGRANARAAVEAVLRNVVEDHLGAVRERLRASAPGLPSLARFAADHLETDHPLTAWRQAEAWPPATAAALGSWTALSGLLLKKDGDWRKTVRVTEGFPAGPGAPANAKRAMLEMLDALRPDDDLRRLLQDLLRLPEPGYSDGDWRLLQALFTVLLATAAHLQVVFSARGRADFAEVAMAANRALGDDLEPSELALRLDYRLRHLLVDEFQDTSMSQAELIRRLTAGWEPGDGRTLFLVGDPMQSIYGFREAEVGLFLDAWQGRLGEVALEPLRLSVNFRSQAGVVDWVNAAFARVLPPRADKRRGAVPYASSDAFRPALDGAAVSVHARIGRDDDAEAAQVLELIGQAREEHPDGTTAVLVRSKAHLDGLIHVLRGSGQRYQAVEIGPLAERPAVMDLMSLTLALLHEADRVAWAALLHGPLCGLGLGDLLELTGADAGDLSVPFPRLLEDPAALDRLDGRARSRAAACARVLLEALDARGRQPLREWVEGAWRRLGGPATLPDAAAAEDVEVFLRMLEGLPREATAPTPERLKEAVDALFAEPDPLAGPELQLMTIHKAKGLEFDTVILPGLGKSTRGDPYRLLYWAEAIGEGGESELFFGPLRSARRSEPPRTSVWIRGLEADKAALETGRQLYVAATRAKRRLHLLGHATARQDGSLSIPAGSLLTPLWPVVGPVFEAAAADLDSAPGKVAPADAESAAPEPPPRWRLPDGWRCPDPPPTLGRSGEGGIESVEGVVFEWAGDAARAVGTVTHRWLQRLVEAPVESLAELAGFEAATRRLLQREGLPSAQADAALARVRRALAATLSDPRGRWLLSPEHGDSRCEWALTARIGGQLRHLVIDRSFVDADGVRWVIDYKTGTHEGGDVAHFLDEEEDRYRPQLERYAEALRLLENRPVRTALYYPLVPGGWRELRALPKGRPG